MVFSGSLCITSLSLNIKTNLSHGNNVLNTALEVVVLPNFLARQTKPF